MSSNQKVLSNFFSSFTPSSGSREPLKVPDKFPLGKENLTSRWVRVNWPKVGPEIRNVIVKTYPRSAAMGVADEHLQGFVTRLIARNDLADHIRSGQKVLTSVLCAWAKQYVASEIRTWGTDGDARASRQARTPANLRALESKDVSHKSFRSSNETVRRVRITDESGEDFGEDFVSNDLSPEEMVSVRQTMSLYEKIIREHLSDHHMRAFEMSLEGHTYEEIGASIGKTHVAAIITDIRNVLRDL
jgi:hypothetical protein